MKRGLLVAAVSMLLIGAMPGISGARGVTTAHLQKAGWFCFATGTGPHCVPPGASASDATISLLVFSDWGAEGSLRGSELLIRADLYAGQPCPQSEFEFLPAAETGLTSDYFACHHYG